MNGSPGSVKFLNFLNLNHIEAFWGKNVANRFYSNSYF